MEEKNIISPCISVCKTDPVSGYCYGCGRTNEDKVVWKNENTTNEWKVNNLKELKQLQQTLLSTFHPCFPLHFA